MDVAGAGAGKRFLGEALLGAAVDHAEARRRMGNDDVVGNGQFGDQR